MIKAQKTVNRKQMIVRKVVINLAIASLVALYAWKIAPLIYVGIRLTIGTILSTWVSK